ncbi:DUF2489 domain-containing protein [Simiduia agarivorans]|uniref:DUF2489 domain-containing protein n=1 Tax=Simiduia agarivorans (strain DSM 21679 / JCM 13881 / BCRC 17597 / SA1) TaxID=1117647 RepID=K4KVH6_SIMAS|nr:DUF2489 domain-containing protein [Simiduia agarivorans]AFU97957.1 hypothetical protein M5M_03740 [Simiduia agarivorans SA1 = DSM 21679]
MIWVIVGAGIVLGLGVYAVYLLLAVRTQQQRQQEKLAEFEALMTDERAKRISSIRILAQGVVDDQLTLTEAAIRITALMDVLGYGSQGRQQFAGLYQLADETLHIPRLQAWKDLAAKDRRRYEAERLQSEEKYRDFVVASARELVQFNPDG